MTFPLALYRGAASLGAPLLARHLARRAARGREDPARIDERLGRAPGARPEGGLVWVHAASVGEALSALPVVAEIEGQGARCLVTTGTVTSARLLAMRAPGLMHRFVPVDTPGAVAGFLDAWRPDAALWMESELWPNLVRDTAAQGVPMALVNGRLSATSARNWGFAKASAAALLDAFAVRLVQSDTVRERMLALGADPDTTVVTGDLKASRPHEPVDAEALAAMRAALGGRPVWLAASTHPGDEAAALDAHGALGIDGLLTIVAPRHPDRGAEVAALAEARGLSAARRSRGEGPTGDVYIADTLGELPLWYALAPVALIGGGWGGIGGHNPLEAAPHDCAILSGDDVPSFAETYARLSAAGAVRMLPARGDLLSALRRAMGEERRAMAAAAKAASAPDPAPLVRTMEHLRPLLTQALS